MLLATNSLSISGVRRRLAPSLRTNSRISPSTATSGACSSSAAFPLMTSVMMKSPVIGRASPFHRCRLRHQNVTRSRPQGLPSTGPGGTVIASRVGRYDAGSMGIAQFAGTFDRFVPVRGSEPSRHRMRGRAAAPIVAAVAATAPRITCPALLEDRPAYPRSKRALWLIADNDFRDRRLDCLHGGVIRRELGRARHLVARLLRRLRVGPQIDPELAAAGQRSERPALPVAHHADIVLVEAPELERLAVGALEGHKLLAKPHALRPRPGRFVVDHDHIAAGPCPFVLP